MNHYLSTTSELPEWNDVVNSGEESKSNGTYLSRKRAFDFVFSALALLLGAPLFLLVALAVKVTSKGPILFSQERVGLNGKRFMLFKFRSMIDGAHHKRDDLAVFNEMNGPIFKIQRDPRMTSIGRFLRKTSLDELPQFWNVLKGDMSIVGPRPHATYEVKNYRKEDFCRLQVKPGLTCFWQIQGRSFLDFDACVQLDLEYIRQMSWKTDMKILLKTIPAVLGGKGAM